MEARRPSVCPWRPEQQLEVVSSPSQSPRGLPAFPTMACASADFFGMTPPETSSPYHHDSAELSDEEIVGRNAGVAGVTLRSSVAGRHAKPMRAAKNATGLRKRLQMREFLDDLLDSGSVEGLRWLDKDLKTFMMPWRHANKRGNGYVAERDTQLTKLWALNTQKYDPRTDAAEPSRWKTNFRCALNSLQHSIVEVENHEPRGFRVYRFDDSRRGRGRSQSSAAPSETKPMKEKRPGPRTKGLEEVAKEDGCRNGLEEPRNVGPQKGRAPTTTTIKDLLPANTATAAPSERCNTPGSTAGPLELSARDISNSLSSLHLPTPAHSDGLTSLDDCGDINTRAWGEEVLDELSRTASSSNLSLDSDFLDDLHPDPLAAGSLGPVNNTSLFQSFSEGLLPDCSRLDSSPGLFGFNNANAGLPSMLGPLACSAPGGQGPEARQELDADMGLYISVFYRNMAVAGLRVCNEHGCRLFAGPFPCQQSLSHEEYERLYGDCKMRQMCLPEPSSNQTHLPSLATLLGHFTRGIYFEMENQNIYATRLCHPQVFSGTILSSSQTSLPRGERTCIFDFNIFKQLMEEYRNPNLLLAMGAQAPAHTIQLCVGQPWGPNRLAANNLVTIQVRHCKAEQLIERLHQEKWIACEPLITDQMVLDELNEDDLKVQRLLRSATS